MVLVGQCHRATLSRRWATHSIVPNCALPSKSLILMAITTFSCRPSPGSYCCYLAVIPWKQIILLDVSVAGLKRTIILVDSRTFSFTNHSEGKQHYTAHSRSTTLLMHVWLAQFLPVFLSHPHIK
ncbi:hypothetical protein CRM22_004449, partial [Opisthorchis felineus]